MRRTRLPVTALLGVSGLVCAGPLVATLLVGRTGMAPSARWLGVTLATWVVLAALGWVRAEGSFWRAVRALAPTAALAVFLPWAYVSDAAFHALSRARWQALGAFTVLALMGLAWHGEDEAAEEERVPYGWSAALIAVVVGMALMYGLNDALFEPLGSGGSLGPLAPLFFLVPAIPALVLALLVGARLVSVSDVAALGAVGAVAGFLAVWLGVAPAGGALFAIAAVGLVAVAHARLHPVAAVSVIAGVALAATDVSKYGLGARELIAAAPELARLLPALGLLAVAVVLAGMAQTSRSAAIGGTREA